jgi:DnaJ-class molecular chaperone
VILKFGKYHGWDVADVPDDYVDYMVQAKRKDVQFWEDEQRRRELMREAEMPMIEKMIKVGYRTLAQQYHPDHGGDEETMRQLNAAMAQLSELISAARDGAYP